MQPVFILGILFCLFGCLNGPMGPAGKEGASGTNGETADNRDSVIVDYTTLWACYEIHQSTSDFKAFSNLDTSMFFNDSVIDRYGSTVPLSMIFKTKFTPSRWEIYIETTGLLTSAD